MVAGQTLARDLGAWVCWEDEAGQSLRPPKARTWARRGHTPVVNVRGRGSGRVSVAGLIATRPGHRPHLYYRLGTYHGRKNEPKGLAEADYLDLVVAAHTRLNAPIVLIWDNSTQHTSAKMRRYLSGRDWLTVIRLPGYAPELNPAEGVWSHVKRRLGNLAPCTTDQLAATVNSLLKSIQYRPELINGFIAETRFVLSEDHPP